MRRGRGETDNIRVSLLSSSLLASSTVLSLLPIEEHDRINGIFLWREVESAEKEDAFGNLERDGGELSKGDAVGGEMGLERAEENAVMAAIAEDECSSLWCVCECW
ncbi:hypothetical protein Bca52824_009323 [Brassica carinata]|uniref:Uncharacterized protein n=1 Tax=Brassica carinata TaxID=52824 RepID=A0A8X7WCX8_BRACI|nr:hypothetical protein Bca52824_009323 [Brassica carinata]